MLDRDETFPYFELTAHDGSRVDATQLRGAPHLVCFFPRPGSMGCKIEASGLRDAWPEIQRAGLTVYGVSYKSPEENREFARGLQLPFLLLSDEKRRLAEAVGAKIWILPFPQRLSFLMDAEGRLRRSYHMISPATHARQVLDDLGALGLAAG